MNVTYAHLCDYAAISDGKLSAIGIFENIFVRSLPAVQPMMYLAFGLELRTAELGQEFDLKIKLVTADGGLIAEISAKGKVNVAGAVTGPSLTLPQTLALQGVPFHKFGGYSLDIFINGDHRMAVGFTVAEAPPPPTAEPPSAPEGLP